MKNSLFELQKKQVQTPLYLDEIPSILGFDIDEFSVGSGIFFIFYEILNKQGLGLILALLFMFILKKLKSGKPRGYVQHFFYSLGLPFPNLPLPAKIVSRYSVSVPLLLFEERNEK